MLGLACRNKSARLGGHWTNDTACRKGTVQARAAPSFPARTGSGSQERAALWWATSRPTRPFPSGEQTPSAAMLKVGKDGGGRRAGEAGRRCSPPGLHADCGAGPIGSPYISRRGLSPMRCASTSGRPPPSPAGALLRQAGWGPGGGMPWALRSCTSPWWRPSRASSSPTMAQVGVGATESCMAEGG